jgi:DNA-binding MarR family transcriptional regulator
MINAPLAELSKSNFKEQFDIHKRFNEQNLFRVLRSVTRFASNEMTERLAESGYDDITSRHFSVFENLDFEGTNIVTLATRAGISKQAMSKLVKEVANGEYVKVITNRNDTRSQIVYFTPKGMKLMGCIMNGVKEYNQQFSAIQNITGEDASITFRTLSKLLEFISNKEFENAILN